MSDIFISERIIPDGTSFSSQGVSGEPGLPRRFRWREQTFEVRDVLATWKEHQPDRTHGSGALYLRKHWFEVRVTTGEVMKLYFERQPSSGRAARARWWLYTMQPVELPALFAELGLPPAWGAEATPLQEASDLVSVGADGHGRETWLAPKAAEAWMRMREAARQDGLELLLVSGFRSYRAQADLWARKLRAGLPPEEIRRVLALPGFSEHHTGRAIDLGARGCADLTESFEATTEFEWLTRSAGKYGFVMSFPRGNSRGVVYEPWHWFFADA